MRNKPTRELAKRIISTASDWTTGDYIFANGKTGERFWIANGASCLEYKDAKIFPTRQKRILWIAINDAIIKSAVQPEKNKMKDCNCKA